MNPYFKKKQYLFVALCSYFVFYCPSFDARAESRRLVSDIFRYFFKVGEINDSLFDEHGIFFWRISDLCCDDEDNLYIADSGLNKIFKFDSKGKYISSFGREGQGPGEFLAQPRRYNLKLSFGNDGLIYIADPANRRISIFSKEGEFRRQFSLPPLIDDRVQANRQGDIYIISNVGKELIQCYDKNYHLKESLFRSEDHYRYPIKEPDKETKALSEQRSTFMELKKVMTREDELIIFSNYSLNVFRYNSRNKVEGKFMITHPVFLEDFKNRLEKAIKESGFVLPFYLFLDYEENLCFAYFNSTIRNWEIYRYKINGTFLDFVRFREGISPPFCADKKGNFYAAQDDNTRIGIFRISE